MSAVNETKLAEYWDKHASSYRMPDNKFQLGLLNAILSEADAIRPLSASPFSFLDNGCGTGKLTSHLIASRGASLPADARFIAADFSAGMVQQVDALKAAEAAANPLWQRVSAQVEDATNLSGIPSASLTHVGASMVIFIVPSPAAALSEAHRVLVPGGAFAFTSFESVPWFDTLSQDIVRAIKPDFQLEHPVPVDMRSEKPLVDMITRAGFVDVRTKMVDMPMAMGEDSTAFWRMFLRGTLPGSDIVTRGWSDDEKERVAVALGEDFKKKGQTVLQGRAIVVAGRKP